MDKLSGPKRVVADRAYIGQIFRAYFHQKSVSCTSAGETNAEEVPLKNRYISNETILNVLSIAKQFRRIAHSL